MPNPMLSFTPRHGLQSTRARATQTKPCSLTERQPRTSLQLRTQLAQARAGSGLFDMAGFAADLSRMLQQLASERGWQGAHTA